MSKNTEMVEAERDQLKADLEAVRSHNRKMLVEQAQLRAEVERLIVASFSQFSKIEELKIACDQWRAVAEGLNAALANDGMEANNMLSSIARCAALAAYEKLKAVK